jgi:hypothetical protein
MGATTSPKMSDATEPYIRCVFLANPRRNMETFACDGPIYVKGLAFAEIKATD